MMISPWVLISLIVAGVVVLRLILFRPTMSSKCGCRRRRLAIIAAIACLAGVVLVPFVQSNRHLWNALTTGRLSSCSSTSSRELVPTPPRPPRLAQANAGRPQSSWPIRSPLELFPEPQQPPRPPQARTSRGEIDEDQGDDETSVFIETREDGEGASTIVSTGDDDDVSAIVVSGEPAASAHTVEERRTFSWDQRTSNNMVYVVRIGGLCLLLLLAYLFLDAGRQPRFPWLRRISILATFVLVCVVLWRMGTM